MWEKLWECNFFMTSAISCNNIVATPYDVGRSKYIKKGKKKISIHIEWCVDLRVEICKGWTWVHPQILGERGSPNLQNCTCAHSGKWIMVNYHIVDSPTCPFGVGKPKYHLLHVIIYQSQDHI